jgi:hypothetical protein
VHVYDIFLKRHKKNIVDQQVSCSKPIVSDISYLNFLKYFNFD